MKKINLIFTTLIVFFSSQTFASTTTTLLSNEPYQVGQGDIETMFSINPYIVQSDAGDNETIAIRLGANYFFTDIIAPGFEFDTFAGAGTVIKLIPNVKLYYPTHNRILPYFQFGIGYEHNLGGDYADILFGPGVNYLLSNNVALGLQFRYDLGAGSSILHEIQFPIQFAIYFKY